MITTPLTRSIGASGKVTAEVSLVPEACISRSSTITVAVTTDLAITLHSGLSH